MQLNNTFYYMSNEKENINEESPLEKLYEAFEENGIIEKIDIKAIELALKKVELDIKNIRRALKGYRKSSKQEVLKG